MKLITLLPADEYVVVNKTILSEIDRKNLISLYEPIIGPIAVSLYLTLWKDLDKQEILSKSYNHHHLMSILKSNLDVIKTAREALEAVGLLKAYLKTTEDINHYVYELYSPLAASEFFAHPIFNIVLYNNIGKSEYDSLRIEYEKVIINLSDFEDISKSLSSTFKSTSKVPVFDVRERTVGNVLVDQVIDFDLLISSLPKKIINEKTFNKRVRELITNLAFIYDLDTLKMVELVRSVLNEKGFIDKDELRKSARNYYQYNNNGTLPTLIYRTQPEYLRNPDGDTSNRGKIIHVFETTSPYDFLKSKYKGSNPTSRDLRLLENLIVDIGLKPAVVNVLVDYVLKKNNNKLSTAFTETIAGQWKRLGIETAKDAMEIAEKEHRKYSKKLTTAKKKEDNVKTQPVWFNDIIEKEEATVEEKEELEDFLKEFR